MNIDNDLMDLCNCSDMIDERLEILMKNAEILDILNFFRVFLNFSFTSFLFSNADG